MIFDAVWWYLILDDVISIILSFNMFHRHGSVDGRNPAPVDR